MNMSRVQCQSSNMLIESTMDTNSNRRDFTMGTKSNTNLQNAHMEDSTKGNSRDFTNSSQEENNDSNSNKKADGIRFSSSNSGNSSKNGAGNDGARLKPHKDQQMMVDELAVGQESKVCIDTVFERYLDLKIKFFTKSILRLEQSVEEITQKEFAAMLASFGKKQNQVSPIIELLRTAYAEKLKSIINDLRAKTKSIEYITMKEIQGYFTNLQDTLRQKVLLFVAKQTELLKFTNNLVS